MVCYFHTMVQIQHSKTTLGPSTQGKPGFGMANFSPSQSSPFCGFSIAGSVSPPCETTSGMVKDGHTLPFDAEPHYADPVLQHPQPGSKRTSTLWWCYIIQEGITYWRQWTKLEGATTRWESLPIYPKCTFWDFSRDLSTGKYFKTTSYCVKTHS